MDKQQTKELLWALIIALTLVTALCAFFQPRWETNDDVGMSMVAHGYGISAISSPALIFSNVIWGYLVRSIPQINGVLGYSIATLGAIAAFGMALLYALRKAGLGWLGSCAIATLVLARPILFPQFTINAGLMTVGAIICWHLYVTAQGKSPALIIGCIFAFCGYLIRSQEFWLVLLVALPLLPWTKLVNDRLAQTAALLLLLAILGAKLIDNLAYRGMDWNAFNALNPVRIPFTDYGAGHLLKQHPEIFLRYGYSENDLDLIRTWFFVDPKLTDPVSLSLMLAELGPLPTLNNAFANGWIGLKALLNPAVTPLIIAAALLAIIQPSRGLIITWLLCLAAFFAMGVLGRPGRLRVYLPVLSLLVIAPFLLRESMLKARHIMARNLIFSVGLTTSLWNAYNVFSESRAASIESKQIQRDMVSFPNSPTVAWGQLFPYEAVYPVLKQSNKAMKYQIYSLASFTLAPHSTSYAEQNAGRGMITRLTSDDGLPIILDDIRFKSLSLYCAERLHGNMSQLSIEQYGKVVVRTLKCRP